MSRLGSILSLCCAALHVSGALAAIPGAGVEDVMAPEFVGVTQEQLPAPASEGAQLYQRHCGQCHHMIAPSKYDRDHWQGTLDRMRIRIKSLGQTLPNDLDWTAIQQYLFQHAAK